MSLLSALKVTKLPGVRDYTHIYKANVSEAWSIGGIPHGGYAVGIILSAAGDLQSRSAHPDPIHLTAHYYQPVDIAESEVRVKVVRSGKRFTNIDAELIQNDSTRIAARIIYGILPDLTQIPSASSHNLTLTSSSPYGRRIPLSQHPLLVTPDRPNDKYLYQIKAEDRSFEERNVARAERQASGMTELSPDAGLEWGAWLELKDPEDRLELTTIPFFADCMKNLPSLLPREVGPGPSWFATVVLAVEFKSRIPSSIANPGLTESPFSSRTVGLYSSSRFMSEGRHDEFVEVWSAPSTIGTCNPGSKQIDPQWREKQVCLAISTQMALTIPEEKSRRARL